MSCGYLGDLSILLHVRSPYSFNGVAEQESTLEKIFSWVPG